MKVDRILGPLRETIELVYDPKQTLSLLQEIVKMNEKIVRVLIDVSWETKVITLTGEEK